MAFQTKGKEDALNNLSKLCHHCGENHTEECPLAKAVAAVKAIPTE